MGSVVRVVSVIPRGVNRAVVQPVVESLGSATNEVAGVLMM